MRTITVLIFAAAALIASGCKKKEDSVTTTPASPYYFKFKFAGANQDLNGNFPQYMPFYANEAGVYQLLTANLSPAIGLRLSWPLGDTVSESDLMALKGKTLYFSDTAVHPILSYTTDLSAADWLSLDTSNSSYNIQITDITFLKKDTSAGNALRTYVITGTCNALMLRGNVTNTLSEGMFHFIICRRDL